MYWGGSSWTDELVDSGTGSLSSYEMILDGTNQPHVGYSGRSSPDSWVRYANRDGTGWHVITATSTSSDFVSASIGLDSASQPMITSQNILGGSTLELHRRVCAPTCSWTYEEIDWGYDVGSSATVLNVMGTPTVAYVNNDVSELRLARRGASTWEVETVDVFADVGLPSIVVDDTTGLVHVSYGDLYNSALRYAQRFSGGWFHTVIDRAPAPIYRPSSSIDLDTLGDPQIAYTSYMGDGTFMLRWAVDQGNGFWEWYDVTDLGVSAGVPSCNWRAAHRGSASTTLTTRISGSLRNTRHGASWRSTRAQTPAGTARWPSMLTTTARRIHRRQPGCAQVRVGTVLDDLLVDHRGGRRQRPGGRGRHRPRSGIRAPSHRLP